MESLNLDEVEGPENTIIRSSTLRNLRIRNWHLSLLEVEAPHLSSLEACCFDKLLVDAPNLETLVLDGVNEIVKKQPWKVTTLAFGLGLEGVEQLLEVFNTCPDAKMVLIQDPMLSADGVYGEGVTLSSLLKPFKHLESLELPCSLPEFLPFGAT